MRSGPKTDSTAVLMWLVVFLFAGLSGVQAQVHIPVALEAVGGLDDSVWERVNEPGFGNGDNFSVVAMAEYQGRLYAMTRNQAAGTEVWRTSGTGWERISLFGGQSNGIYGNPWINNVWGRMVVFRDELYVGFSSGLQGNYLGSTGCEIWRYDGTSWEPVISDKRAVDESGTLSSIADCANNDGSTIAYFYDSTKSWTAGQWAGGVLTIVSGTGHYRKFRIIGNTATRLTVQQNEAAGTLTNGVDESEYTVCAQRTYNNPFPAYSYTLGQVSAGAGYEINLGWDQNGFGTPWNKTITAMVVHEDRLYVSTGLNYEYGGQIWYSEDGDSWEPTGSALTAAEPHTYFSFGNFHAGQSGYPGSLKPVSSSITDLAVSSVSGEPVLYAGGTGTSGPAGGCARMARLTGSGWQMIVDSAVDGNDTGSNENGFGSPAGCGTNQYNFMPWSLADFMGELMVGVTGQGARVIRAPLLTGSQSMLDDGRWYYSVGEGNTADGYTDPLGTSAYPDGFDGYTFSDGTIQNLSVNLHAAGNTLFAGTISFYVPEYNIPSDINELLGAQLWRSPNGMTWQQVTADGFGDSDTIMFEAFTAFNGSLYVSGSKGASSTPSGLGGAKIYRLADDDPCVSVQHDQSVIDTFERHTVTGITTELPGPDPNPPGFPGASFLRAADLDGDGVRELVVTSVTGASGSFWTADGAVAVFKRTSADLSTWTQSVIRADFAWANDVLIRDVDRDGEIDIMVFDNFLAGAYTNFPAGIYLLRNLGGDVCDPANWQKITLYAENPAGTTDPYERARRRASYHQAYFLDLDGDGDEDFVTTRIAMEIWQAPASNPDLYGQQYMWLEWFRAEDDPVSYPTGFSGPYLIGDGAGFLFGMADVDGDGLQDVLGPQFFITVPGSLAVKGGPDGSNPCGDTFVWFKNPGQAAMASDPEHEWERYTIDNWYTSANPMGKGFMAFAADIDNDGRDEIMFTGHNHQESVDGKRIWPSGVYYLEIPADPYDSVNWLPVTIDAGDAYVVDRPGGPYSQGSPGHAASGDVNEDGLADVVAAGDGRGALYYYEAADPAGACSLAFRRGALYDDPASMPAEIKLYDMDGDGDLEILATVYDTSLAKDSSSGSVFIWNRICRDDADCGAGQICIDSECVAACELEVTHRKIRAEKLFKPRRVVLKIEGADGPIDVFGRIDLGPLTWKRVKFNQRKNRLKIVAIVPAGLGPGAVEVRVGDCSGMVMIE